MTEPTASGTRDRRARAAELGARPRARRATRVLAYASLDDVQAEHGDAGIDRGASR